MATATIEANDHKLLVAGERVETGEWSEVHSPYDDSLVGRVPKADGSVVDRAVKAAREAFDAGGFPQHERAATACAFSASSGHELGDSFEITPRT